MRCCCLFKPIRVWIYLFVSIRTFHNSNGLEPRIDPQHEIQYPNCGIKPQGTHKHGGSRMSNSVLSKDRYPWVIKVIRTFKSADMSQGSELTTNCGGTIISNTAAITAGHCVCGYISAVGAGEYCDLGKDTNQIRDPNNLIHTEIYERRRWHYIRLVTIDRAYVMYDQTRHLHCWLCIAGNPICTQRPKQKFFHDLGIIRPREGTSFKQSANFIVPLCLPADDTLIPAQYFNGDDALITVVGEGNQYNEVPDGEPVKWQQASRNPKYTSCTTSQFGNTNHDVTVDTTKIKRCAIEFLKNNVVKNGWRGCRKCHKKGCSAADLPVGYEFDKCKDYWIQAKKAVKKMNNPEITDKFSNINKIKVVETCGNGEPQCLKWDLFKKHGWCRVEGGTLDDWAICDQSCDQVESYYNNEGRTVPEHYNIMQWIDNGIKTNQICNSANAHWLPTFYACVQTLHKNVNGMKFHQNGQCKLKNDLIDEYTEEFPRFAPGFQHTCNGDSGGGHWMKEGGNGGRQILIGVVTQGNSLCGDASYMEKINNKDAMRWITGHLYP